MATTVHSRIWGATSVLTQALSVTGTAKPTASFCSLTSGWEGAWITASVMFTSGATLAAQVRLHASIDGNTWESSDNAIYSMNIDEKSGGSKVKSFPFFPLPPYLRLDAKILDTTQQASVSIRVKPWRWKSI